MLILCGFSSDQQEGLAFAAFMRGEQLARAIEVVHGGCLRGLPSGKVLDNCLKNSLSGG